MNRLSLHIGINYPGSGADLSGCVHDAEDWQNVCAARGYETTLLLDNDATLSHIVASIHELMARSKYRDRLVVTYSGHGTYGHDASGDEPDKRDEAIVPADFQNIGMLYDDEIRNIMSARAWGSRLLFVADSCFSGSVNRFAGFTASAPISISGRRARFLRPSLMPYRAKSIKPLKRVAGTPALLLSGCDDTQFSYDAWFGDRANGAFTRVALETLKEQPRNYRAWHKLIRQTLPSADFPQSPELEGSAYRKTWSPL